MERIKNIFHSHKRSSISSVALQPEFFGVFPLVISVSFAWRSDDNKSFIFFIKDETGDKSERLYAFSIHRRGSSQTLTLYAGTDPDASPPLALGGADKASHSTSIITLPSHANQSTPINCTERLENKSSHRKLSELFHFQLRVGEARVTESFEWRQDSVLHRSAVPGRRLVRLSSKVGGGGEEVVGVWSDETPTPTKGNKLGTFQFLGSGATGELGAHWTLMAVMTLLRVLEINSAGPEALAAMAGISGGMVLGTGLI